MLVWHLTGVELGPNEKPLSRVGNTTAAEVNETTDWLAGLTREKNLPQKVLILHQFQVGMIQNREQLNINHPELAFVVHIDGNGTPRGEDGNLERHP